MRPLRAAFLVLLAALLPLRGAVAGALDCPPAAAMHGPAMQAAMHDTEARHDHAAMAAQADVPHAAGHTAGCHLCATACSLTPMPLGAMPPLAPSMLLGLLRYPALAAPAPTFESSAQDRPPRTS